MDWILGFLPVIICLNGMSKQNTEDIQFLKGDHTQ